MQTIKIKDCFNKEQNLNVEMIYKIVDFQDGKDIITAIHLNHKDDNYTFSTFKTYESKQELLLRLESYK